VDGGGTFLMDTSLRFFLLSNNDDDDDDDDDDDEIMTDNDKKQSDGVALNEIDPSGDQEASTNNEPKFEHIGKETEYDDFCGDDPEAPELIRRCLAVLRCICLTSPAESFLYPVDPRSNIKYYDAIMKPMSLYDIGKTLQHEGKRLKGRNDTDSDIKDVVTNFGRNVRLIYHNCAVFSNAGAAIISTVEEMIRVFERVFFDWVLSPKSILPPLDMLDDDRCVEFHPSDEDSMVLLCDGCEGKFNMSRLDPPLSSVPKGDWYCPRCRSGYCWASVDPRVGQKVSKSSVEIEDTSETVHGHGIIKACLVTHPEERSCRGSLTYIVSYPDGSEESWTLSEVDEVLKNASNPVPPIHCLEAVAESPGYGCGVLNGLVLEAVPIPLNPLISDTAAQNAVSSTVFQDMVVSSATLLVNETDAISAIEWLRILILLVRKCASSEKVIEFASKIENEAYTKASEQILKDGKTKSVIDVIPMVTDEDDTESDIDDSYQDGKIECKDEKIESKDEVVISEENPKPDVESNASKPVVQNDELAKIPNQEEILENRKKKEILLSIKERQKARENSLVANCIKMQVRAAVSSFEEDNVSNAITSYLSPNSSEGVGYAASRCRSIKCDLCGLTDMALATPLVRAPNQQEWLERMSIACSNRTGFLVADIGAPASCILEESNEVPVSEVVLNTAVPDKISSENVGVAEKGLSSSGSNRKKQLAVVSIQVAGDIISSKVRDQKQGENDLCMVSFLPRNEIGFQHELDLRHKDGVPFITGSLSAHDSCALAAHKARMEKLVQDDKEKTTSMIERNFGNSCGRTISIGTDESSRFYWKFDSDSESLFVSNRKGDMDNDMHRYSNPESIASVIKSLGKQPMANVLKNAFPQSAELLSNGMWSNLLQKRKFRHLFEGDGSEKDDHTKLEEKSVTEDDPYEVGEEVLVESPTGVSLWDAKIIAVGKSTCGKISGYRVHYKEWSSRFDEWVNLKRVVEQSEHNILVQEELREAMSARLGGIPSQIQELQAKVFLDSPNRARLFSPVIDFSKILKIGPGASCDDQIIGLLRCATLLIEAALPAGSVKTSTNESWAPEKASCWRSDVMAAESSGSLMGCVILLENMISKDWLRPNAEHLLSCLPRPWKAISEASLSSIALRLWILDSGIKYELSHQNGEWEDIE